MRGPTSSVDRHDRVRFSIYLTPESTVTTADLAALLSPRSARMVSGRLFFSDGDFSGSFEVDKRASPSVIDLVIDSGTRDVTRERWPLEFVGALFAGAGGRLAISYFDDDSQVLRAAEVDRLGIYWSAGALLVDERLRSLARAFKDGWGERARWVEAPLRLGVTALIHPGWFAVEGERETRQVFSPFATVPFQYDRWEGRIDQLTLTGPRGLWAPAEAAAAVRRLIAGGATSRLELSPVVEGFRNDAVAACLLNSFNNVSFEEALPLLHSTEEDQAFLHFLRTSALAEALEHGNLVRLLAVVTGVVHLRSAAGPIALFWPDDPTRLCLGFPFGSDCADDRPITLEQRAVAEVFRDALQLDWVIGSTGQNLVLSVKSFQKAALGDCAILLSR